MRISFNFIPMYLMLVIAQILICNFVNIGPYVSLSILPAMVLCIPMSVPVIPAMILGTSGSEANCPHTRIDGQKRGL